MKEYQDSEQYDDRVVKCDDGKYRWAYEVSLLRNPVVLFTIFKIFGGIIAGIWLFMVILSIADGGGMQGIWFATRFMLLMLLLVFALSVIGYLVYAAIMGGKLCVLYEMDDASIVNTQIAKQFKKAQVLAFIGTLVGAMAKNPTLMGSSILAGSRQSASSDFANVRSVQFLPRLNTIKVNEPFMKNQIYVRDEDFDFVRDFILANIPQDAKIKR